MATPGAAVVTYTPLVEGSARRTTAFEIYSPAPDRPGEDVSALFETLNWAAIMDYAQAHAQEGPAGRGPAGSCAIASTINGTKRSKRDRFLTRRASSSGRLQGRLGSWHRRDITCGSRGTFKTVHRAGRVPSHRLEHAYMSRLAGQRADAVLA